MRGISAWWQGFSARAESIERQSPFAPPSLPIYAILGGLFCLCMIIMWRDGLTFSSSEVLHSFWFLTATAICGLLARSYGLAHLAIWLEACSLPSLLGATLFVATALMCRFSTGLADQKLAAADAYLHFSWMGLFRFYQHHRWIIPESNFAYRSMIGQTLILPITLIAAKQDRRFWQFLTAWGIAAMITVVCFAFLPAAGSLAYYGTRPEDLEAQNILWPWMQGPVIQGIQSGRIHDIAQVPFGLVSFPSFHACSAMIFIYAGWKLRFVWPVILTLNVMMILSTPIRGSHYLIDVLGGVAVALLSIALVRRTIKS